MTATDTRSPSLPTTGIARESRKRLGSHPHPRRGPLARALLLVVALVVTLAAALNGPRRRPAAVAVGTLLLATALLGSLIAVHAHRSLAGLESFAVAPGVDASGAPDPGDMEPLSAFSYAVVGPIHGNHAALERALSALRGSGVETVLLRGPVLETPEDALPLAAVIRSAGLPILAAPAASDLDGPAADAFERHISPHRWWFVRKDCLFTSVPPEGHTDGFRQPKQTFDARFEIAPIAEAVPSDQSAEVMLEVVHVDAAGKCTSHESSVRTSPTPAGLVRDLGLVHLRPVIASGVGLGAVLGLAALLATLGLGLVLPPARRG